MNQESNALIERRQMLLRKLDKPAKYYNKADIEADEKEAEDLFQRINKIALGQTNGNSK